MWCCGWAAWAEVAEVTRPPALAAFAAPVTHAKRGCPIATPTAAALQEERVRPLIIAGSRAGSYRRRPQLSNNAAAPHARDTSTHTHKACA